MVVIVSQQLLKKELQLLRWLLESSDGTKIRLSLSFNVLVNHEEFCCQKHTRIIIRVRVKKPEKNQLSKKCRKYRQIEKSDLYLCD